MAHRHLYLRVIAAAALALAVGACNRASTAGSVLQDAQDALGNPTSIRITATGGNGFFGQALTAGQPWPMRELSGLTRTIDFESNAAMDELSFAQPVFGGQQQTQVVSFDRAWNVGANGMPAPQLAAVEERQLAILMTPHGFVRAGLAAGDAAMLTEGDGSNTVTFTALDKYRLEGTIDDNNQVTSVRTTIPNTVLGDTALVASYSDYRDFNGIQFPGTIQVEQGGFPTWQLTVSNVEQNPTADFSVPAAVQSATPAPVEVASTQIAPGVWHVAGGSHHSVVIEFADHIAVAEAPLSDERSLAVIAEAKRLVPDKPIRYLLTTHHHFDHTGGFRTYVAEGATIVTHQSNVDYFEQAAAAPATLMPDTLANNPQQPMFQGVSERTVLTDGRQTIEIYPTSGDTHTNEYTLIYLPGPRILIEGDAYSPGPANAPPPQGPPAPNTVKLYEDIQALGLNVATIAPIHGRGAVPFAELRTAAGK